VALGLGSVVSAAVSTAPWLVAVGQQKAFVFSTVGALLALNYWLVVVRARRCPPGQICHADSRPMRWNRRVLWLSVAIYAIAAALTFAAGVLVEPL
jgi:hypothetical protein